MSIVEVKNISKSFKGVPLFENANAEFAKGKIHGIVGPNGSGKSVLFKLICGFLKPDSGTIVIDSEYRTEDVDFPKGFGIVIDRPGYLANKTGFENLKRLASIQNIIGETEIKEAMETVGLKADASQKVKNYSLGMKQKLALAQAIMEKQEVLILDEPFNALDSESVQNIRQLLLKFKENGKTIIMTSHNSEDIDLLCDQVYQINNQKLESKLIPST